MMAYFVLLMRQLRKPKNKMVFAMSEQLHKIQIMEKLCHSSIFLSVFLYFSNNESKNMLYIGVYAFILTFLETDAACVLLGFVYLYISLFHINSSIHNRKITLP